MEKMPFWHYFSSFYFDQIMTRKGFKYRIYPNTKQKEFFAKCFGCVRFFYNKSLNDMKDFYKENGSFKDISPTTYKKDYPFLKEIDSIALQMAQYHRNKAFKSFFAHKTRFPKFKSKKRQAVLHNVYG